MAPIEHRSGAEEGGKELEETTEESRVEQERRTPIEEAAKLSTQGEEEQNPTEWGPQMWTNRLLRHRPGLTRFFELRELKKPPGLTFDPSTMSLSVSPSFPRDLYFHEPMHHKTRPWIEKPMVQRARAWAELDQYDKRRVEQPSKEMNRTTKRRRGCTLSYATFVFGVCSRVQKNAREPVFTRWCKNVAPELPERLYGHIDGILPKDAEIYIEEHESYIKGHSGRVISCVWVAINASLSVAMRACNDLAIGKTPHPDWDILTPLLQRLCTLFQTNYDNTGGNQSGDKRKSVGEPRRGLPPLRDIAPPGHDIPVVLAFRQAYLLLIWKGGIEGKLVAQYQGHCVPMHQVGPKPDLDQVINELQLASLRQGADEGTISRTSGGKN